MNVYYTDRPLTGAELIGLGRVLGGVRGSARAPIEQRRVGLVLPVREEPNGWPTTAGGHLKVLRKALRHAGAGSDRDSPVALVMPDPPSPVIGKLALALRDICGVPPYVILRGASGDSGVRVIEADGLLEWASSDRDDAPAPRWRR
ncbi:MAG TPA: hypothetical protein VFA86_10925 [Gammaproteobacteria bacterium]|nr:hypothetical protein [Gammaproteobacteria bacterium]